MMRDLALSKSTKKSAATILECVGADIDEPKRNISFQQVSDVGTISTGGQSLVQPGSSLQINIRDQGVLLYLDRTMVCGEIRISDAVGNSQAYITNALALFQPLQVQLGALSWGLGSGHYLLQLQNTYRAPEELRRYARGLLMRQQSTSLDGAIGDDSNTAIAKGITDDYKFSAITSTAEPGNAGRLIRFAVPLKYLMAGVLDVPDDVLYLGSSQNLLINCRITTNADVLVPANTVAPLGFTLQNMTIFKVYSELDSEQEERILRSSIQIPVNHFISAPRPGAANISATYNLGRGERLKEVMFGLFPQATVVSTNAAGTADITAGLYAAVAGMRGYSQLQYHPMVPITYMQVSVNGHQVAFNGYQLQSMLFTDGICDKTSSFADPWHSFSKHCVSIDMSRFGNEDWYGAGEAQENVVQIEIIYGDGLIGPYFRAAPTAAQLASFSWQSFIRTQRTVELKNSIYTN